MRPRRLTPLEVEATVLGRVILAALGQSVASFGKLLLG